MQDIVLTLPVRGLDVGISKRHESYRVTGKGSKRVLRMDGKLSSRMAEMSGAPLQKPLKEQVEKFDEALIVGTLAIAVEQITEWLPHQFKPEHYVTPVIREMTAEWKKAKRRMADAIVAGAVKGVRDDKKLVSVVQDKAKDIPTLGERALDTSLGLHEATESLMNEAPALPAAKLPTDKIGVAFTTASRSQVMKEVRTIMGNYKVASFSLMKDALKKAKKDTVPKLVVTGKGRGGFTTLKLSKEGMQQVVDSLEWQKGFVDDITKSVVDRVSGITKGRYASSYDLRQHINREFRIDRDKTIARFHTDVEKRAQSVMTGGTNVEQFKAGMRKDIENNYRKLYKEGNGGQPLKKWETDFIRQQADTQNQYLNNFGNYIQQQKDLGRELTGRVSQRAHLYAERGTAMFEAGHLASLPDDVIVDWKMQPAEHCPTCPIYQRGSPYTKETLPGLPGEGFNVTRCGTNCQCIIQVSDLYVTSTPDVNRELAIKVTDPDKPPTKIITAPKPKTQKLAPTVAKPKAGDIPKAIAPTDDIAKAMGKTKYADSGVVRKDIIRIVDEHNVNIIPVADEVKALKQQLVDARKNYPSLKAFEKSSEFQRISTQLEVKDSHLKALRAERNLATRQHTQVSPGGFKIKNEIDETYAKKKQDFQDSVNERLKEVSTMMDESVYQGTSGTLRVRPQVKGARPRYSDEEMVMSISKELSTPKVAHEVAHWIEIRNPQVKEAAKEFYDRRTKGEKLVSLNKVMSTKGYGREKTKVDKFANPFMGKHYEDGSTEILAMGVEYMMASPSQLAKKDPEMFDFIYKLLRGLK